MDFTCLRYLVIPLLFTASIKKSEGKGRRKKEREKGERTRSLRIRPTLFCTGWFMLSAYLGGWIYEWSEKIQKSGKVNGLQIFVILKKLENSIIYIHDLIKKQFPEIRSSNYGPPLYTSFLKPADVISPRSPTKENAKRRKGKGAE